MKVRGEVKLFGGNDTYYNELYRNKFNFNGNCFLETPFGFYLIYCQTILLPMLQAQLLRFIIVTSN